MKLLFIVLLCPILSYAQIINCKVVDIIDGDTITCFTDKKKLLDVRLFQIDAPEAKQAFGEESKQALSYLILNRDVEIQTHGKDEYERTLGTLYDKNADCILTKQGCHPSSRRALNVNLSMIERGVALYYPVGEENDIYKQAEEQAREYEKGLWSQAIAP